MHFKHLTAVSIILISHISYAQFKSGPSSHAIAREVAQFISEANKGNKQAVKRDFDKIVKLCSSAWHKGCAFKKSTGKDKFQFQIIPSKNGKDPGEGIIYGIPSYLMK